MYGNMVKQEIVGIFLFPLLAAQFEAITGIKLQESSLEQNVGR